KTTHQQIAKHQKQLNESAGKKEYDALKAEIAADKATCQQLEDAILEGMAGIDERTTQLPDLEKAVQRAKAECAEFERNTQARRANLTQQLEDVQRQLKEVEATLPSEVRPQYERLLSARGEDAMAGVQQRVCTACYTEITAQNYNEL